MIIIIIHSFPDVAPLRVHAGYNYGWLSQEENRGRSPGKNSCFYMSGNCPITSDSMEPLAVL